MVLKCLKTSEITSTNLTIWNDRTCRWAQIWRICSHHEFARECKYIWYCINQTTTLNLFLKATKNKKHSDEPTNSNSQRVHSSSTEIKSATKALQTKADKITIQRNSAKRWLTTSSLKNASFQKGCGTSFREALTKFPKLQLLKRKSHTEVKRERRAAYRSFKHKVKDE